MQKLKECRHNKLNMLLKCSNLPLISLIKENNMERRENANNHGILLL